MPAGRLQGGLSKVFLPTLHPLLQWMNSTVQQGTLPLLENPFS